MREGERRRSSGLTLGDIPADLVSAKTDLRDRLFLQAERSLGQAFALRKAKRFHPSPDVNLVGVGIGERTTCGKPTGEMCVKVFVAKKYPKGRIRRRHLIQDEIGGIPTDIEGVGYPTAFAIANRRRHRPVRGGVSVGLDLEAAGGAFAGTLGVVVADKDNGRRLYALSNNHILANENLAEIGDGVMQPGPEDGGKDEDRVATLARFVPLKFGNRKNWMDVALARFKRGVEVDRRILGIGVPSGSGEPGLRLAVRKSGRTSGLTEGIVRETNFDVTNLEYERGMVRMENVIVIRGTHGPFSEKGDSGAAVVDPGGRVVALLFAGTPDVAYAIPIQRILRRLNVRIAT